MFFKTIDKFFNQLKGIISFIIFILITMSSTLFIYWLAYSAKLVIPDWLSAFLWAIIDFFAQGFKSTPLYGDVVPVLPVLVSGIFIILTYFANCIMAFLENNHKRFLNCVEDYKVNLEKTINEELHKDFIEGLKKTQFMLVKIKIVVTKHTSYLTAMTDEELNASDLKNNIEKLILNSMRSEMILKKGVSKGSVYFIVSELNNSRDFFADLVSNSSQLINKYIKPKVNIDFYCGADLFSDLTENNEKSQYLDKIIDLKLSNKIVITPKFKVFFDNIIPDYYTYTVLGEYNLSGDENSNTNVMLHAIKRKD